MISNLLDEDFKKTLDTVFLTVKCYLILILVMLSLITYNTFNYKNT